MKADALVATGRRLAAGEPDVLRRVKLSRMSVDYAIVERARLESRQRLPINGPFLAMARERFAPFFQTLQTSKITRFNEWEPLDKEAYRRDIALSLQIRL